MNPKVSAVSPLMQLILLLVGLSWTLAQALAQPVPQTLTFSPPSLVSADTPSIQLQAETSSGLPVVFSVVSGPAEIVGDQLFFSGTGAVVVSAQQEGNELFLPVSLNRTVLVADPPTITQQPTPINVPGGSAASLSVTAIGTPPLAYQWAQNSSKLAGRTSDRLAFANASPQQNGLYYVIITNAAGSITSSVVSLTVNLPGSQLSLRPRGSIAGFALGAGSGAPVRTQVRGRYAYLANGWDTKLYVVDIADPDHPTTVASVPGIGPFGGTFEVALIDDFALTAERDQDLGIIDIRNPLAPVRVGKFSLPGGLANSIVIRDRLAYVGNEEAGVIVLDVNIPDQPVILGQARPPANVNGIHLVGDRAFVANWASGLSVVDISNPSKPTQWKPFSYSQDLSRAFDVVALGNFAYMADSDLGLVTIDTSRTTGIQVGRIAGSIWDITQLGRYLFTADANSGFRVFDVSAPKTAVEIGRYGDLGRALGCMVRGNRVFLGERRFSLMDLSFASMAPVFSSTPEQRAVVLGSDVVLEANTTGTEPMSFRWFHGEHEIAQATGPTLNLDQVSVEALGQYSVIVANAFGTVTNQIATLVANSRLSESVTWLTPGQNIPLIRGESYTLEAATGSGRPVQFVLDVGAGSLTGNVLKTTANGPITLRAVAPGDAQHLPAAAARSFTVVARPQLLANSVQTDSGQTIFRVIIGLGVRFAVMASEDLRNWREIAQLTATQANTEVADPETQQAARYYRIELR